MPIKASPLSEPDRAISFAEAEVQSGIPTSVLQRYRRERRLQVFRFGRSVFVSEKSLLSLMETCREPERATSKQALAQLLSEPETSIHLAGIAANSPK